MAHCFYMIVVGYLESTVFANYKTLSNNNYCCSSPCSKEIQKIWKHYNELLKCAKATVR